MLLSHSLFGPGSHGSQAAIARPAWLVAVDSWPAAHVRSVARLRREQGEVLSAWMEEEKISNGEFGMWLGVGRALASHWRIAFRLIPDDQLDAVHALVLRKSRDIEAAHVRGLLNVLAARIRSMGAE